MEEGWDVRYCVTRCVQCDMLMDVFVNFTPGLPLSEMWPHLLAVDSVGVIQPSPPSKLNKLFENGFFVLVFFMSIFFGSLIPEILSYSQALTFDADRFVAQTLPVVLLRWIALTFLLILFSIRSKLIDLFRNSEALAGLLRVKSELLYYWANFAVSCFTGYQLRERLITPNAVMFLGGVSSCIILGLAWLALVLLGATGFACRRSVLAVVAEATFWMVVAYAYGIPQVSLVGVLLTLVTAALIVQGQLLVAGVLYILAASLDLLDGVLARLAKLASRFGAFLDSTADRVSEGVVFAAIAYHFASRGQSVDAALTVLALLGSVLVSYTRARAEGLGLECKVGIMTRAERVLLVALGLMSGLLPEAVYLLVALTAFSAMQRIVHAFRQLNPQG